MRFLSKCPLCKVTRELSIPREGYEKWSLGGVHIQDAMPEVPADVREMLISGTCPDCWKKMTEGFEDES